MFDFTTRRLQVSTAFILLYTVFVILLVQDFTIILLTYILLLIRQQTELDFFLMEGMERATTK